MAPQQVDSATFMIMPSLSGKYAIVEKKYVCNDRHPTYIIISSYPTIEAAQYAIELIR